jgi:hypothetical protein
MNHKFQKNHMDWGWNGTDWDIILIDTECREYPYAIYYDNKKYYFYLYNSDQKQFLEYLISINIASKYHANKIFITLALNQHTLLELT